MSVGVIGSLGLVLRGSLARKSICLDLLPPGRRLNDDGMRGAESHHELGATRHKKQIGSLCPRRSSATVARTEMTEAAILETRQKAMGQETRKTALPSREAADLASSKVAGVSGLFGTSEADVALLNRVAPAFFSHVQAVTRGDILLHLCRLTDRAEIVGRRNLTVAALSVRIPERNPSLRSETEKLSKNAIEAAKFARTWRNRELAHLDHGRALEPKAHQLESVDAQKIERALNALAAVLNRIQIEFQGDETAYERSFGPLGGARVLLRRLRTRFGTS